MSLEVDKTTMQIVMNSVVAGACAHYLTPLPAAGGVVFGVTMLAAGGLLKSVLKTGNSTMQKIVMIAVHMFAMFAAAWAVTGMLFTPLSLKATLTLSGGILASALTISVIVQAIRLANNAYHSRPLWM